MLPTYQQVKRSVEIDASAPVIYEHLIKLENFNRFSVWSQQDSSAVNTLSGTDGTVGAASSWKGSPEISGEGRIEIKALIINRSVTHQILFIEPKKLTASSVFDLLETNKEKTTVTWTFRMNTPRPWNIFNLLSSIDKDKGQDFEEGLTSLKKIIENERTEN